MGKRSYKPQWLFFDEILENIDSAHNLDEVATALRKVSFFLLRVVRRMNVPERPLTIVKTIP